MTAHLSSVTAVVQRVLFITKTVIDELPSS